MEGRYLRCLRGDYWKSEKGTNCFRPKADGKHILVQESWGHRHDRGDLEMEDGMVYFRRASSNGGGNGYTYAILPFGWTKEISLDDI